MFSSETENDLDFLKTKINNNFVALNDFQFNEKFIYFVKNQPTSQKKTSCH